ncbi:hypothetical protein UY3_07393 [Chelonia mydas]|uniref:Uncharacterized protein n=1 Tax=Chelonia mydas TaxID=8469 RepID=M7BIF6_CHEMY|nr:hypothetical protein UY3_07393 [Chelonia mydas]
MTNYLKLNEFLADIPEGRREQFQYILTKGQLIARTVLQTFLDVMDMAVRTTAMVVIMRRASWLQSSGIPRDLQTTVEDLPFDREKLFSTKTDKVLHSVKDSRTTLQTLGIYTPPNRRRRYQPYHQNRDTMVQRQQRPFHN